MHHSNWSRASWTVTYINRNWRWLLAIVFLLCGFVGFMSGVGATERDLDNANPFTLLYYSMGLFILGGMDLGVPVGGPLWGRTLTWIAYFGAPLLTTSALVEWLQVIVANPSRWLRYLRAMEHSDVVQLTHTFNSYHLAAQHMVRSVMMEHFRETEQLDTVVIAGFGRFNAVEGNGRQSADQQHNNPGVRYGNEHLQVPDKPPGYGGGGYDAHQHDEGACDAGQPLAFECRVHISRWTSGTRIARGKHAESISGGCSDNCGKEKCQWCLVSGMRGDHTGEYVDSCPEDGAQSIHHQQGQVNVSSQFSHAGISSGEFHKQCRHQSHVGNECQCHGESSE